MPDNILYSVQLPDGRTTQWSQDQYEKAKDNLFAKYPEANVVRTAAYDPEDTDVNASDKFDIQLPDGRVTQWTQDQFSKAGNDLMTKYPDARIIKTSDMSTQYWEPKAQEAKRRLDEFNAQHGDFMRQYEFNKGLADSLELEGVTQSGEHDYIAANDAEYQPLSRQREELRKAYYGNPVIAREFKANANAAEKLRDDYTVRAEDADSGPERRDWKRAAKLQDDIRKLYDAPNKYIEEIDGSNGFAKFLRDYGAGAGDVLSDKDFWTRGLTEIARNNDLRGIAKKMEEAANAKPEGLSEEDVDRILTPGEKAQIMSFYRLAEAQKDRAENISGGYTAGGSFAESLGFMAEFMLSSGLANVAGKALSTSSKGLASWLGRELMSERAFNRAVEKGLAVATDFDKLSRGAKAARLADEYVAKPLVQGLWHTGTQVGTLASISDGLLDTDSNGQLISVGRSVLNGVLDSVVENWSESFGGAIEKTLALPFEGASALGKRALGKTGFGRWARWLYNSAPTQLLKEAGFNGMIGEIGEEWAGNAVRVGVGLMSPEEFKDFASWEQQLEMAASFAPMSLIGLGTSSYSAIRHSQDYKRLAGQVQDILQKQGVGQNEIDALFNTKFDTAEDIAKKFAPYLRNISADMQSPTAEKDYKTMLDFAKQVGVQTIVDEMDRMDQADKRNDMRELISGTTGRFWQEYDSSEAEDAEDNPARVQQVHVLEFADGHPVFIIGGGQIEGQQEFAIVDETGKKGFIKQSDIDAGIADGSITSNRVIMLDDYLQQRVDATNKSTEAQRMAEETRQQVGAIRATISADPNFNMGTEESPVPATVTAFDANGVHVVFNSPENGQGESDLTWKELGDYLGTPILVKTDEQIEADAAAARDEAQQRLRDIQMITPGTEITVRLGEGETAEEVQYPFEKAILDDGQIMVYYLDENGDSKQVSEEMVVNLPELTELAKAEVPAEAAASEEPATEESAEVPDDGVLRDFRGNEIPLLKNGEVNRDAFFKNDTEAWARWNDEQNQDGGVDSIQTIQAAMGKVSSDLAKAQAEHDKMSSPGDRYAKKGQIEALNNRLAELQGILDSYAPAVAAEEAAQEATEAPAATEQPASASERIPKDKKGNLEFEKAPVEDTADALLELAGDDLKLAMSTARSMNKQVRGDIRKAEKAKVKGDNPVQIIQNTRQKEQKIQEMQARADYWNNVVENLRRRQEAALAAANRAERDLNEPQRLEEAVANYLATLEPNSLDRADFKRELGWGNTEMSSFFRLWAKAGAGRSLNRVAEDMAADDQTGFVPVDANGKKDVSAVRNAIINVMNEVSGPGELKNYTRNANLDRLAEMEDYLAGQISLAEEASIEQAVEEAEPVQASEEEDMPDFEQSPAAEPAVESPAVEEAAAVETVSEAEAAFEAAIDEALATQENSWDKILDYIYEHYPTQANVSSRTNSPEGLAEREAMKRDSVLQEMLRQHKKLENATEQRIDESLHTLEDAEAVAEQIEAARQEVNTNPTDAQKEAGNYKKGHVTIDGYDISIENPKGSIRRGTDAKGNEWQVEMHNDYGYIRMTEGVDGDHIDVFLSDNPSEGNVFVVDQVDPEAGEFDEHKVMYGFPDAESARAAYLSNYSEGWQGLGVITEVTKDEFKKWIESSHRKTKPFSEYKSVTSISGQNEATEAAQQEETPEERRERVTNEAIAFATGQTVEEVAAQREAEKQVAETEQPAEAEKAEENEPAAEETATEAAPEAESQPEKAEEGQEKTAEQRATEFAAAIAEKERNYQELYSAWLRDESMTAEQTHVNMVERRKIEDEKRALETELLSLLMSMSADQRAALRVGANEAMNEAIDTVEAKLATMKRISRVAKAIQSFQKLIKTKAKTLGKLNLYSFTSSDDNRPAMAGVFHDKGYAVASDTTILIADKESYQKANEGKIVNKKGETVNAKFPKWRDIIPSEATQQKAKVNFGELRDFLASVRAQREADWEREKAEGKKVDAKKKYVDDTIVLINVGKDAAIGFRLGKLSLFADAAERYGAKEILFQDARRAVVVKTKKGFVMLMPTQVNEKLAETTYETVEENAKDIVETWNWYSFGENEMQKQDADQSRPARQQKTTDEAVAFVTGSTAENVAAERESEKTSRLQKRIAKWKKMLGNTFEVITDINDVKTESARQEIEKADAAVENGEPRQDNKVSGWFDPSTKKAYIYLPHISDEADLDRSILHEVIAHKGIRALFPTEAEFNKFLDYVYNNVMTAEARAAMLEYVGAETNVPGGIPIESARAAADEFIAHVAERNTSIVKQLDDSVWNRIVEAVKRIIEDMAGQDIWNADVDVTTPFDGILRDSVAEFVKARPAPVKKTETKAKTSSRGSKKIEDFGEKIGGARKDLVRSKVFDTAKLSSSDLKTLGSSDKILSPANIIKSFHKGEMDEQTARIFLALGQVAKRKMYGSTLVMLTKFRDLALAWANGQEVKVEITDHDLEVYASQYSEAQTSRPGFMDRVRQDLEYIINGSFSHYLHTYELMNYPAVERKLGSYVIRVPKEGEKGDGRIWIKSSWDALRGYVFKTEEDAVNWLEKQCPAIVIKENTGKSESGEEKAKYGNLDVVKDQNGWFRVKSRLTPGSIFLSKKFSTREAAEKYLEENHADLEERERQLVINLLGSNIGSVEREGPDYRGGADVTEDEFQKTFGTRGVEFGNWVPQRERQLYLNKTYDAIMDLAEILGISPKAFTHGGRLALAFGARGKSRALAHYEPMKEVINLTRMSGAGSLAHEWWHSFDNYMSRIPTGSALAFATVTRRTERDEVAEAFKELTIAVKRMDYARRSRNADGAKPYWSMMEEMTARLFESYVYNKFEALGRRSPLLVRKDTLYGETKDEINDNAWPYPSKEENEIIKPYFDRLFAALQEREDEKGNVLLFRRSGTLMGLHNISEEKLRKAIKTGGLANPSAAVIDINTRTHDNFGEVSLLMPSSLVDSETGDNAGIYTGDAWSPTYPGTRKVMSENGNTLYWKDLLDLPEGIRSQVALYYSEHLESDRTGAALMWWFLQDTGRTPDVVRIGMDLPARLRQSLAPMIERGFYENAEDKKSLDTIIDLFRTYGNEDEVARATKKMEPREGAAEFVKRRMEERNAEIDKNGVALSFVKDFYDRNRNQLLHLGEVDIYETFAKARQYVDQNNLGSEFTDWLQDRDDRYSVVTKLFYGYDENGDPRLFDNTVENASMLMNNEPEVNSYDNGGLSATRSALLKRLRTLSDIRKNRTSLSRDIDDEELKRVEDQLFSIISRLADMQQISDNQFTNIDLAETRLQEALASRNPVSYLNAQYGYHIPSKGNFADDLRQFIEDARALPVKYFEVKFQRPVRLNEFAAAVVPSDLSDNVRKALTDAGLPIYEYGEKVSRQDATMSASEIDGIRFRRSGGDIFISNAAQAVESISQEKATPEQWLKMIEKNGGLKAGEDKWIGLSEWLKSQDKKTLTKQEVEDYIRQNSIQVDEVNYTDNFAEREKAYSDAIAEVIGRPVGEATFGKYKNEYAEYELSINGPLKDVIVTRKSLAQKYGIGEKEVDKMLWEKVASIPAPRGIVSERLPYTTRGLKDKREIALTVPTIESWRAHDLTHFGDAGEGRAIAWVRFGEAAAEDGGRIVFIDEIQSSRHQEGRKKGYADSSVRQRYFDAVDAYDAYTTQMEEKYGLDENNRLPLDKISEEEKAEAKRLRDAVKAAKVAYEELYGLHATAVPAAPFEKNWHELAMKRMLRYAAENGFDYVAWTTGEQQAERYDLQSRLSKIDVHPTKDGNRIVNAFLLNDPDGDYKNMLVYADGSIEGGEYVGHTLAEVLGGEMADKILGVSETTTFEGAELKIGGAGMKSFYDGILPRFIDKYGKRWGVSTKDRLVSLSDGTLIEAHTVEVTPEMKESVMQGQLMFRRSAPNGRPSNLIDEQWKMVRTAEFKRWFGDWELAAMETPIHHSKGTFKNFEEASEWARKNLQGKSFTNQFTGEDISISRKSITEMLTAKQAGKVSEELHKAALMSVPDFIETGIPAEMHPDTHGRGFDVMRLYNAIELNGEVYRVKSTVKKLKEGDRYYTYELQEMEIIEGTQNESAVGLDGKPVPSSMTSITGAKLLKGVKKTNSDEEILDYSRIVDENGEPLVVYHGTPENFTVFDPNYADEASELGQGFYFTDNRELAETYTRPNGDNQPYIDSLIDEYLADHPDASFDEAEQQVMATAFSNARTIPVFLNIRKPFYTDSADRSAEKYNELLSGDYDGIIDENFNERHGQDFDESTPQTRQYLVKEPTQIKSATENTGDFNPEDPDIRFRKSAKSAQENDTERFRTSKQVIQAIDSKGLADVIGDENVSEYYNNLYRAIPEEIRESVVKRLGDTGLDFHRAMRTQLSDLAFNGIQSDESGLLRLAGTMLQDYIDGDVPLGDRALEYIFWRIGKESYLNDSVDIAINTYLRSRAENEQPSIRFRKGDLAESLEAAGSATESAAQQAQETLDEKKKVLKGNLLTTAKAMAAQKEYDKSTIDSIVSLAKSLMKEQFIDTLNRREIGRLLGIVTTSLGKAPRIVKKNADVLVDMIVDHLLRSEEEALAKLVNVKATKVNATGVEVQGQLDIHGQNMLKAYKAGLDMEVSNDSDEFDELTIKGRLAVLSDRLSSPDDAVRSEAQDEHNGLMLALEYHENIKASRAEEKGIRNEMKDADDAYRDGDLSRTDHAEFKADCLNALRENRTERIEAYRELRNKMAGIISGSIDASSEFRDRETARIEAIHHLANSDMQGQSASPDQQLTRLGHFVNSSFFRFFASPLATFDQMLRLFGRKNVSGEGYLWNKYMRGWVEATEKAYLGQKEAKSELDKKVSEVFGRDMMWSDLYRVERKMPKLKVKWWDGGEKKDHELTQGNLLYIYMVNKMADGRMKLRKMGIDEADVKAIERQMDERFLRLADWLQNEYLVEKRNKYNAVHERLFGASMAAIDNYFPLKINKRALNRAEDIGKADDFDALPATTTGSIIKRRRNAQNLDLLNADAFSVVIEHIDQMEQWAAFAEFNKDLNTLLSYKRFRNQVQNMTTVYGAGTTLWNNFKGVARIAGGKGVARIAGGVYRPSVKSESLDSAAVNLAKGVTSAKISFRVYTALKQFLSMPAFLADANVKHLAGNMAKPWVAWNWAMENLPVFEKRWKSRIAGDTRLMNTDSDWKFFRSRLYDKLSKMGMSPNAFVDAVTVAIGSHAMYQTKYDQYIRDGYSEEIAEKKAKQDATVLYNETQQSSEGAFLSTVQLDRTVLSTMISVFRNSSMGYQRQFHDALRNIGKMMKSGYKEESLEYMQKQMERDGLTEEQAKHAAERRYEREVWHNAARVATFGFAVQFAWNLGASIAYLLFGDDDDEKAAMLNEALVHALLGGTLEGLAGGNVMSEALDMIAKGESLRNYDPSLLPLISDIKRVYQMMGYDRVAGANELVNLFVQAVGGVNPQTITDAVVAVVDACGGDMDTSREAMLLIMRVLQVPQSQLDEIYIDELGTNARNARRMPYGEMAERYARYKINRGAPITGWAYSDELEDKREKAYLKSFKKKVNQRKEPKKK